MSPPNEQGPGLGTETLSKSIVGDDTASIRFAPRSNGEARQLVHAITGKPAPDGDPQRIFRAAELLADSWGPALDAAMRTGYETGFDVGWLAGRDDERTAWNQLIGVFKDVTSGPRCAELVERRKPTNEPCAQDCGRCSRCVRSSWVTRNGGDFLGRPDGAA